jgi:hypothetical protein
VSQAAQETHQRRALIPETHTATTATTTTTMMTTTTTKIRCVYINWYGMAWHDLVLYGMVYINLPTHLPD